MTTTAPPELAKTNAAQKALDLRMIPIGDIAADRGQPRKTFDAAKLDELAESLKQGQTNAIKVRPRRADEDAFTPEIKWVLMHGERRLRAAQRAEIPRLRAEVGWSVAKGDEARVLLEQIADNLQRVDLGAVEEAAGIRRYAELSGLGTKEVAAKIGKNPMYVSLAIGMGDLPKGIVTRIERDARESEETPLSWRHIRQLVRLKDEPDLLEEIYDHEVIDYRSTARDLENTVTQELAYLEQNRKREAAAEKATAKAKAEGKPEPVSKADGPMSHMSESAKREALEKARMTRVRKDLIRGSVPGIVAQVNAIEQGIQLPEGLALSIAGRVNQYDVKAPRSGQASTGYGENIAALVVPELPGKWSKVRMGAATHAGSWAADDEAGRQWLAFAYWLATETKGFDADLDRQSRDVLKARDQQVSKTAKAAAIRAKFAKAEVSTPTQRGMIQSPKPPRALKGQPMPGLVCAREDCKQVFHVKQGQTGRRPKYCVLHRSR